MSVDKHSFWSRIPGPLRAGLSKSRADLMAVFVFSAALNLLYLAPSIFMLQVYDRVLTTGGLSTLTLMSFILLVALLVLSLLDGLRGRLMLSVNQKLDQLLSPDLLRDSLSHDRAAFQGVSRGQILREWDALRSTLTGPAVLAAFDLPWVFIYVAICALLHPAFGVLALVGIILLVGLAVLNERAARAGFERQMRAAGAYALLDADLRNAEPGRVMGMTDALVARQLVARTELLAAGAESAKTTSFYSSIIKFTRLALQSGALALGALLVLERQLTGGALIAGSILIARSLQPIEQLVAGWRQLGQALAALDPVRDAMERASSQSGAPMPLPAPMGALRVENVSVRKPGTDGSILLGIVCAAEPGEIMGIVGPSGAGKSTLVRVMAGGLVPDSGKVRLDGASLSDWDRIALGRHIGYLPQEPSLFTGTIAQNICRFDDGADPQNRAQKVVAAARAADVHELILSLPKGYDTLIGLQRPELSFGQMQRVALARALYDDPHVVILDEPNAHLDADGEAALTRALQAAKARGAVIIAVAHRTGFLAIADKLLILRDGRVQAFGPREQVLARMASGAKPGEAPRVIDGGKP